MWLEICNMTIFYSEKKMSELIYVCNDHILADLNTCGGRIDFRVRGQAEVFGDPAHRSTMVFAVGGELISSFFFHYP